jgi:hypothetical protein
MQLRLRSAVLGRLTLAIPDGGEDAPRSSADARTPGAGGGAETPIQRFPRSPSPIQALMGDEGNMP